MALTFITCINKFSSQKTYVHVYEWLYDEVLNSEYWLCMIYMYMYNINDTNCTNIVVGTKYSDI